MLSVLYVDDEQDLLELGKIFLEQTGGFCVGTITSAPAALASPLIHSCDAIISDYQMPGMDGIAFLKEVRGKYGDVPFILFTGRGREEVVIQAINNGADFYLQKGGDPKAQFAELAHKVRQAVARRQAELQRTESEKRLSDIINFLPDATFAIDRSGHVIAWNRAIEEMTGVAAAGMLGRGDYEYAIPFYGERRPILIDLIFEPNDVIAKRYANIVHEKDILIADTTLPRPKGRTVTLMGKASPLYNPQGEIVGAIESIRDITALKTAEQGILRAKKDWETIFRAIGHPAIVLDPQSRIIDANDATLSATGKTLDELKGRLCYEVFHKPGTDHPPFNCPCEKLRQTGSTEMSETEIEAFNGYYAITCTPVYDADGRLEKVIHIAMDVTARRQAEEELRAANEQLTASDEELRGQYEELAGSEQRIRESESRFRQLAEATVEGIVFHTAGVIFDLNERAGELFGYRREEMIGRNVLEFASPDSRELVRQNVARGYDKPYEAKGLRKDGSVFFTELQSRNFVSGTETFRITTIWDITDRKRAEAALRESEWRFRELADLLPQGVYEHDVNGRITYVNRFALEMFGYTAEDIAHGVNALDVIAPRDRQRVAEVLRQRIAEGVLSRGGAEYLAVRKDGSTFPVSIFSSPVSRDGRVVGTRGVIMDITEQKKAADEIRAASEQLAASEEELRGQYEELAMSEKLVRESEEKYHSLVELSPVAVVLHGDGKVLYANPEALRLVGAEREEDLLGRDVLSFIHPGDREMALEDFRVLYEEGRTVHLHEERLLRLNGDTFTVEVTAKPIQYRQTRAILVIFRDITDRKRSETELRAAYEQIAASEKELRGQYEELAAGAERIKKSEASIAGILRSAPIGIGFLSGRTILRVNDRLCEMTGYSHEEVTGRDTRFLYPDDDEYARVGSLQPSGEDPGAARKTESRWKRKDGTVIDILLTGIAIDPANPAAGRVYTVLDITDEKRQRTELAAAYDRLAASDEELREQYGALAESEQRIRESESYLASIFRSAPAGIGLVVNRVIVKVNDRLCQMTGYPAAELLGKSARILYPSDEDFEYVGREKYEQIRRSGTGTVETRWQRRDGALRDILLSSTPLDPADHAKGVTFTALDITERNQTAAALRQANLVVENSPVVAFRWKAGEGWPVVFVSNNVTRFGYTPEELLSGTTPFARMVHPDDLARVAKEVERYSREGKDRYRQEYRILARDGRIFWVDDNTIIERDGSGTITHYQGVLLDITERKQAEEALRESEERYRVFVETANEGIWAIDAGFITTFTNRKMQELFGYGAEEMLGRPVWDFVLPGEVESMKQSLRERQTGKPGRYERQWRRKDGSLVWCLTSATPLFSRDGRFVGSFGMFTDITKRRQVDEALRESGEKYRNIIGNSPYGMHFYELKPDGALVFTGANPAAERILKVSHDGFIGKTIEEAFPGLAGTEVPGRYRAVARTGEVWQADQVLYEKGAIAGAYSVTAFRVSPGFMAALFVDITERKRMEEALRESEERYRSLFEKSHAVMLLIDPDTGVIIDANPAACAYYGWSHDELAAMRIDEINTLTPEEVQAEMEAVRTEDRNHFLFRHRRADGSVRDVEVYSGPLHVKGRLLLYSIIFDITERRQVEEELKSSESSLRLITENMADLISRIDRNRTVMYVSPSVERLVGYPPGEFIGTDATGYIHPDDRDRVIKDVQAAIGRHLPSARIEFRFRHHNGKYLWFESETRILYSDAGEYDGAIFASREITHRKRVEKALRAGEERLKLAMDASDEGLFDWNLEEGTAYFSPRYVKMLGYDTKDLPASFRTWENLLHPDDRDRALSVVREYQDGKRESHEMEFRLRTKDGGFRWILSRAKITGRNAEGKPVRMVGTHTDITDRKRTEADLQSAYEDLTASDEELKAHFEELARSRDQLAESEEKYRALVETTSDFIWEVDDKGRYTYVSPRVHDVLGYQPDELIGKTAFDVMLPGEAERVAAEFTRLVDLRLPITSLENRCLHKDGSVVVLETSGVSRLAKDGSLLGYRGIDRDITARKRAEEALRRSEDAFRSFVQESADGIALMDEEGLVIEWNDALARISGIPRKDAVGKSQADLMVSLMRPEHCTRDRIEGFRAVIDEARRTGTSAYFSRPFEAEIISTGGERRIIQQIVFPIRTPKGFRIGSIARDITDRKRAEEALYESEENYRTLVEVNQNIIYSLTIDGTIIYVSPQTAEQLGYQPHEMVGRNFTEFIHPEDSDNLVRHIGEHSEPGTPVFSDQFRVRRNDGTYRWYEDKSIFVVDRRGRQVLIGTIGDITERKTAEEALRVSEARLQSILHGSPVLQFVIDNNHRVISWNRAIEEYSGITTAEILGTDQQWRAFYPKKRPVLADLLVDGNTDGLFKWYAGKLQKSRCVAGAFEGLDFFPDMGTAGTWLAFTAAPVRDAQGMIIGAVETLEDITERKRAEDALRLKTEELDQYFSVSLDLLCIADTDGYFRRLNPEWEKTLGYPLSELTGRRFLDFVHPGDMPNTLSAMADLAGQKKVVNFTNRYRHKDGTYRWIEWRSYPQGNLIYAAARDVTERRLAEQEIQQSRDMFRTFIDHSYDAVFIHDQEGRVLDVNATMLSMYRISRQDALSLTIADFSGPGNIIDDGETAERWREVLAGKDQFFPWQARRPGDGSLFDVEVYLTRIMIGDRGVILANVRDVTGRRRAEAALRESEAQYRKIFESFVDIYYETDTGGIIKVISPSVYALAGWKPEELIGKTVLNLYVNPADRRKLFERLEHEPAVSGFEVRLKRRDGKPVPVSVNARIRYDAAGAPDGIVGSMRDITENVRFREALQESEKKYRHILEKMQDAYFQTDTEGKITMVSPSAVQLYRYDSADEMIGMPAVSLYQEPEERREMLRKLQESGRVTDFPGTARRKDGTTFWASLNVQFRTDDAGKVAGSEAIVRDISERRMMEHSVQEANRKLNLLNSITRHDVVNQLTILQGYTQIALMNQPDLVVTDLLSKIEASAKTIGLQIEFTKTYQELGARSPSWFRIEDIVKKAGNSTVKVSVTCRDCEVFADPMLERVFYNLFDNAARHGKTVTEIVVRCEPALAGIAIIVEDNGIGVPADEKEKIFRRGYGKHTGLGLFLAKEILAITGITIRETGVPGKGARFEMLVPEGASRLRRG